jgi:hypothetical protein
MDLNFKTIHSIILISITKNQFADVTYGFPASLFADNPKRDCISAKALSVAPIFHKLEAAHLAIFCMYPLKAGKDFGKRSSLFDLCESPAISLTV